MRKRDYQHEYKTYHGKPEQIAKRAQRNAARAKMEKKVGAVTLAGKDVDHKKPLRSGGGNGMSNLRVQSPQKNRGWRK